MSTKAVSPSENIIKWYYKKLEKLKEYKIENDSVINEENSKIKLGTYSKDKTPNPYPTISKRFCEDMKIMLEMTDNDDISWVTYSGYYAKSKLGNIIYDKSFESVKDSKYPNLFKAISTLDENALTYIVTDFVKINTTISEKDNINSLKLVLLNAIRYYYVHSLLADILTEKELCTGKQLDIPCIITTSGSNDCMSDYDVLLYLYDGRIAEAVTEFYKRTAYDWYGKGPDVIFDTNIYTSTYLIPYELKINDNLECKNKAKLIRVTDTSKEEKGNQFCSSYLLFACENNKEQVAYAMIHLLMSTPLSRINRVFKIFRGMLGNIDEIKNNNVGYFQNVLNDIHKIFQEMTTHASVKLGEGNKLCFVSGSNDYKYMKLCIQNLLDNEKVKTILYEKYTRELYDKVNNVVRNTENNKEGNGENNICDLLARINICLPETYYTFGPLIMAVGVDQKHINNLIGEDTGLSVFVCALMEDYAFIMDKYESFLSDIKKDTNVKGNNIKNLIYIGGCAKYAYRIANSMCAIHAHNKNISYSKTDVIDNIINGNKSKIPFLEFARKVLQFKKFKTTPNDDELNKSYTDFLKKYNFKNNRSSSIFKHFICLVNCIIQNKISNLGVSVSIVQTVPIVEPVSFVEIVGTDKTNKTNSLAQTVHKGGSFLQHYRKHKNDYLHVWNKNKLRY